jgi:nitrate/nitrite transport system substrate-binding protein
VKRRAECGERPLFMAAVFAESNHNLDLRRWLRAGGVVPDRDVRIGVAPPGEVEQFLERGIIDGFCVGEPWGSLAVARGVGRIVTTSYDLWSNRIEKVLGVGVQFATENPNTLDAMLQAVLRGAQWADEAANRAAVASLLVHGGYVDAPIEVVRRGLTGRMPFGPNEAARDNADFLVFHRYAANFPWLSQADWFGRALGAFGVTQARGDARAAFRPELLARATGALGMAVPTESSKAEAAHGRPWVLEEASQPIRMGREAAFDGANFEQDD